MAHQANFWTVRRITFLLAFMMAPPSPAPGLTPPPVPTTLLDSLPASLPSLNWHLTARPWSPLNISRTAYLDRAEHMATFWSQHQNSDGSTYSPITDGSSGYSNAPTFQYPSVVATLVAAGRTGLLSSGATAEDYATTQYANNTDGANGNDNFWVYPLVDAIHHF